MSFTFVAAAETHKNAYPAVTMCRKVTEPYLNESFEVSKLSSLNAKIRYIPIIMPPELLARHPARSELIRKERICDCAPQLDYELFISGDREEQLRTYVRGIASVAPYLEELGATEDQMSEFSSILRRAEERVGALGTLH